MSLQSQRHQTLKTVMPVTGKDLLGLVQVEQRRAGAHVACHRRHQAAHVVDVTMTQPRDHLPRDEDPTVLQTPRLRVGLAPAHGSVLYPGKATERCAWTGRVATRSSES